MAFDAAEKPQASREVHADQALEAAEPTTLIRNCAIRDFVVRETLRYRAW
jgi:hypothetical protein